MSELEKLASDLRDSQRAIRLAEESLAADGGSFSSELNLASLQKLKANLEAKFAEATNHDF